MFFGGGDSVVCDYGLMCVRCVSVGVVEALYEPSEFGGICVECGGLEKLLIFNMLFL